eukprot:3731444-Rhodomonas_salina.3
MEHQRMPGHYLHEASLHSTWQRSLRQIACYDDRRSDDDDKMTIEVQKRQERAYVGIMVSAVTEGVDRAACGKVLPDCIGTVSA